MPLLELSVLIASRDRPALLQPCLRALAAQTQALDSFEVIVADGDSTDDPAAQPEHLGWPFALHVLHPGRVGQAAARNAAVHAAQGRICLILDDDLVAAPELLAEHVGAHRTGDRQLGIGRIQHAPPQTRDWYLRASAQACNRRYDGLMHGRPDWTAGRDSNLSALRTALIAVGGFATPELPVSQELELAFRLSQYGCSPQYLSRALAVRHDLKPRRQLLEDLHLQGEVHVQLAERHAAVMPKLLGSFGATSQREIAVRRTMMALRVRPSALARLGPLLPGRRRRTIWFEFVARLAYWRGVRRGVTRSRWRQLTAGVPVLLYHAFGDSADTRQRYIVPRPAFAKQMRILAVLRYRVIAFEDLARCLQEHRLAPRRAVVITIDDGYVDNFEVAYPILQRRGFPATIFLVSDRMGEHNDWSDDPSLRGRPLLSVAQLTRPGEADIRFGAHTRTHCRLSETSDDRVRPEIQGSRDDLEQRLGTTLNTFAYPYGDHDERSVAAVKSSGFLGAGTTEPRRSRLSDDPALIPRIEIRASDSLPGFVLKLWFGNR